MGLHIKQPDFPQTRDSYAHVDGEYDVPKAIDGVVITEVDDSTGAVVLQVTLDARFDGVQYWASRVMFEEGTQRVDRKILGWFDPEHWARFVLSTYGFKTSGPQRTTITPDPPGAWGALNDLPKRRSVTQARLAEVAAAYQRGGAKAVERDCNVSRSQAFRLVKQAREAGVLGEVER